MDIEDVMVMMMLSEVNDEDVWMEEEGDEDEDVVEMVDDEDAVETVDDEATTIKMMVKMMMMMLMVEDVNVEDVDDFIIEGVGVEEVCLVDVVFEFEVASTRSVGAEK